MFTRLAFVVTLISCSFASTQSWAQNSSHHSVYERYQCQGEDFSGETYQGWLNVELQGETYVLKWDVTFSGGNHQQYQAIGLRLGNTLSASWAGSGVAGLIVYQINNNGTMDGKWTVFGNKSTRMEQVAITEAAASGTASRNNQGTQQNGAQLTNQPSKPKTAKQLFNGN